MKIRAIENLTLGRRGSGQPVARRDAVRLFRVRFSAKHYYKPVIRHCCSISCRAASWRQKPLELLTKRSATARWMSRRVILFLFFLRNLSLELVTVKYVRIHCTNSTTETCKYNKDTVVGSNSSKFYNINFHYYSMCSF
jgi:hypothetical protein